MSITFKEADGRDVVAADTAETIGKVKSFILDRSGRQIEAIQIGGRSKGATILPWNSLDSFGADAVVTSSESNTHEVADERELESVKGDIRMRGSRILTTAGFAIGEVADVAFDPSTGSITSIVTKDDARISGDRIVALGTYALVVEPES